MPQLAAQAAPSVFDVNLGGPASAAGPRGDANCGAAAPPQRAAAPAPAAAAAPAEKPEAAPPEAPGVTSKWTLVDYDEEGAALCARAPGVFGIFAPKTLNPPGSIHSRFHAASGALVSSNCGDRQSNKARDW